MYQLSMSISADYVNWYYAIESRLKHSLDNMAILVTRGEKERLYIAVACENQNKKKVREILFDTVIDMFAVHAKRYYYEQNLIMPALSAEKYNILLAALVEFDSSSDKALIADTVELECGLNIDGVYNFIFGDIKSRWKEVGDLTKENAVYLCDNEIFFELIKYLFSAIVPKTNSVSLFFDGRKYSLYDDMTLIKEAYSEEELLCSLISIAPLSLELKGEGIEKNLKKKLNSIFGQKDTKSSLYS